MKIPNYQDRFSYEDAMIANRVRNTYDCGLSPIALISDDELNDKIEIARTPSECRFRVYSLKLFYAIQVWNKVAIMTHENPGSDGSLYYWWLGWKDVEGSPFREITYHDFCRDSIKQLKELFWSKLEQVANSGEIHVSESYFLESRSDYEWGGESRYYATIVLDEARKESISTQECDIYTFPYDKTPHTYTWDEIKHFFIELTLHQLALTFPKALLHKHSMIDDDLFSACYRLDLEGMKRAIANGANVNAINEYGNTPLATIIGNLRDVQCWRPSDDEPCPAEKGEDHFDKYRPFADFLIESGADVDLFGRDGYLPLLEAYYSSSVKAVKYLLEKGANPNYNCFRDDDHCPHKCSSVLNAIDFLISEDYTQLEQELERITREAGGRLYVNDYDPVMYERTGKITIEVWPYKDHLFFNDRWRCGLYDTITIPDLDGEMHTYNISSVQGLKEWHAFFLENAPFYSDKQLPDSVWQEWWQDGMELMKQVRKLLPDYVTMYYLYEGKPVFRKKYDGDYYWNFDGEKVLIKI